MHYEIDPDKSHLEEIVVGLYKEGFGRGYGKEEVSWRGALQHQVVTWRLIRQIARLHLYARQLHVDIIHCELHAR